MHFQIAIELPKIFKSHFRRNLHMKSDSNSICWMNKEKFCVLNISHERTRMWNSQFSNVLKYPCDYTFLMWIVFRLCFFFFIFWVTEIHSVLNLRRGNPRVTKINVVWAFSFAHVFCLHFPRDSFQKNIFHLHLKVSLIPYRTVFFFLRGIRVILKRMGPYSNNCAYRETRRRFEKKKRKITQGDRTRARCLANVDIYYGNLRHKRLCSALHKTWQEDRLKIDSPFNMYRFIRYIIVDENIELYPYAIFLY